MADEDTNPSTTSTPVIVEDDDRWKGIQLGSCCFKTPIYMHWSFYFLVCASLFLAVLNWSARLALFFILLNVIIFISVLVHELAHAWVTKMVGGQTDDIVLWPLGGLTVSRSNSAWAEFRIAIAGPLSHLPMIALWAILFVIVKPQGAQYNRVIEFALLESFDGFLSELFLHSFFVNICILLANIIMPTFPLDGARCLASLLVMTGCSTVKAAKIIAVWSMIVSVAFIIFGAYLLFTDDYIGVFLMIIGALNFSGGNNLLKMAKEGKVKEDPLFGRPCFNEGPSSTNDMEMTAVQSNEAEMI